MKKRQFLAAALFSAAVMTFGTVSFGEAAESLQIKEQGIFSAGGTVLHSPGTFDISHYYTSREGNGPSHGLSPWLWSVPHGMDGDAGRQAGLGGFLFAPRSQCVPY